MLYFQYVQNFRRLLFNPRSCSHEIDLVKSADKNPFNKRKLMNHFLLSKRIFTDGTRKIFGNTYAFTSFVHKIYCTSIKAGKGNS